MGDGWEGVGAGPSRRQAGSSSCAHALSHCPLTNACQVPRIPFSLVVLPVLTLPLPPPPSRLSRALPPPTSAFVSLTALHVLRPRYRTVSPEPENTFRKKTGKHEKCDYEMNAEKIRKYEKRSMGKKKTRNGTERNRAQTSWPRGATNRTWPSGSGRRAVRATTAAPARTGSTLPPQPPLLLPQQQQLQPPRQERPPAAAVAPVKTRR